MLRFPAAGGAGIVVIEIGPRPTHAALLDRVRELLIVLGYEVAGRRVVDRQARPCTNSPPAGRRRAIRRAAAGALGLDAVERERGTSVSSAVLSFEHEGLAFNLLDGPGHQDFIPLGFQRGHLPHPHAVPHLPPPLAGEG